ncbi:MAG TPA: hypothetical protein VHF06_08270, partial [Pseudonocardiaceae bacterium]|nr:hypothetical protein [Pseudonocardiaceae bacterium]
ARALLWARLTEPHVARLVTLADELARGQDLPVGVGAVPYPDADGGGIHAQVLFLLNDPGEGARVDSGGTGMLCLLNDDQTTRKQPIHIAIGPGRSAPGASTRSRDRRDGLSGCRLSGAASGRAWAVRSPDVADIRSSGARLVRRSAPPRLGDHCGVSRRGLDDRHVGFASRKRPFPETIVRRVVRIRQ